MRSVDDLTAAARIREAAMQLFGERGVAGVSVREVAAAAGVSPGLVIHHYKSKDGLKRAVDERALTVLAEMFDKAADPRNAADGAASSMAEVFAAEIGHLPVLVPYLRRLLVDGGEAATALFRGLFESTRATLTRLCEAGVMAPARDDDVRTAFLLVNDLGAVILREQIRDVLGFDPMSPPGLVRWGETVLDVYSSPVYTPQGEQP